jgi:pimeloyl-ACP methyl ester carboxylesterase
MRTESGRALWETLNWWMDPLMTTHVGFGPAPAPTLILNGDQDRIHPADTAHRVARRLNAQAQILPGMSHWLVGEPGWESVAGAAVDWLNDQAAHVAE